MAVTIDPRDPCWEKCSENLAIYLMARHHECNTDNAVNLSLLKQAFVRCGRYELARVVSTFMKHKMQIEVNWEQYFKKNA